MESIDCKELALKKVEINGNVIGKFASFEIEQVFKNNKNNVLEVSYTFPIIDTATVVGFEVQVGEKVFKGKCKEKEEAKKEYCVNILKGNSAYIMEQSAENIFTISVGKLDVDEEARVKIYYIDKLEIVDNTIKLIIPTLVAQRYKSKPTSNLVYSKNVDYTVDFNIRLFKNLNIKDVTSTTHKINFLKQENVIHIKNYDLNTDCKLDIKLKNELVSNALIAKSREDEDILFLSFMPEIADTYEDSEKEYVFIVDVSGSMRGENLIETKRAVIECLKQLDDGDKFNIVPFESRYTAMSIKPLEYNKENLEKAIEYVNSLEARGGTEILSPIKFALYEEDLEKIVLLFTDGQVGNEREILDYVTKHINKSRIFPFGIDDNVNAYFINQLAKCGNGKGELIYPNEKIDEKIIRTFARIQTPLLEDLKIDYGKNKVIDEIREDNVLFNYEFFNVFTKVKELKDDIVLTGKILDKKYSWTIKKEDIIKSDVDLEVLLAKQEVERLEKYMNNADKREERDTYKKLIVDLCVKYNINSVYTSFISVNERDEKIFAIPEYEETVLMSEERNSFVGRRTARRGAIMTADCLSMDSMPCPSDLDIPTFLRKNKVDVNTKEVDNTKKAVLKNELEVSLTEYFEKEFINSDHKKILTYILFAILYLSLRNSRFDYKEFLKFLEKNKKMVLDNIEYSKLLRVCYELLPDSRSIDRDNTFNFINDDYVKVLITGIDISDKKHKIISEKQAEKRFKNGKIAENVNELLYFVIDQRRIKLY